MNIDNRVKPITILIIEDNRADIRLLQEVLKRGKIDVDLQTVEDGIEAMSYLKKENKYKDVELPDLVLLDLNLPLKSGHEVLAEMKEDENLRYIPVIVMTISRDDEDVLKSYHLHANAYIIKPIEINQFIDAIKSVENFWLTIVKLPPKKLFPH